jgi:hypothetical protein
MFTGAAMSRRRALREIEQNLAASDPHLNELLLWFTAQARGEKIPATEKVRRWPVRLLTRPGRWGASLAEDRPIWPRAIH